MSDQHLKDDALWRETLSAEEYRICREKGTEAPFSGEYNDCKTEGAYTCRCCGTHLFESSAKFDSGSGWPSFFQRANEQCVGESSDTTHGMTRTEIVCAQCNCHLGHVFPDGPQPTGLRYCVNSASIKLSEKE